MKPRMIMGVPKEFFAFNWFSILGFMTFAAKMTYFFIISAIVHVVFFVITKKDPIALKVLQRYFRHSYRYEPWPLTSNRINSLRPNGWGRKESF